MTRSELMARIRSRRTGPERRLMAALASRAWKGWRMWDRSLPGCPDLVHLPSRTVVMVNSCFFHGCPYHYKEPKTNRAFWREKIRRNKARDRRVARQLRAMGFRVLVWWQCEQLGKFLQRYAKAVGTRAPGVRRATRRSSSTR